MQTEEKQRELLKKLYLEYYHSLFLYARSVLQDPSLAEEAVQDTFCIACVKQEQLAASGNPAGCEKPEKCSAQYGAQPQQPVFLYAGRCFV